MRPEETAYEASVHEHPHRTFVRGDQASWAEREHDLREIVRSLLRAHPRREVVCRYASEEYYVTLAFERFRQTMVQGQATCKTPAEEFAVLRASLNGAILETLRITLLPGAVSKPVPGEPGVQDPADDSTEVWKRLQSLLATERERRLAYLLYHCGLSPQEIVHLCPQEWSDVPEIVRLRRMILERLLNNRDQLREPCPERWTDR